MKIKVSILTLSLVSAFGLTSCSSDPGEDSWRLHPPHISDPGNPQTEIGISDAHMEMPSASAELVFDEGDLSNVVLSVTSSCRGSDERAEETYVLSGVHRIPLASLWPADLWKKLKASELEEAVCGLAFKATTVQGSTHSFKIEGLRLRGFATFNAQALRRQPGETWTLLCDGFTSETVDEPSTETSPILALARRSSELPNPLGHQTCRLFTRSDDTRTGLRRNRLSHDFQLSFPNSLATVETTFGFDSLGTPRADGAMLALFRLTNPGAYPIAYRVVAPKQLSVQPVVRMTRWDLITTTERSLVAIQKSDEALALSISGEAMKWSQDGFDYFVIAPHSTAVVGLNLSSTLRCLTGKPDLDLPPYESTLLPKEIARAELAGFYFGFNENMRLESIDYWSAAHPRDPSDSYTPVSISLPRSRHQPFHEGFQGIPAYLNLFDKTGRAPMHVAIDEHAVTKWCKIR